MERTILFYITRNGVEYEYRIADGMKVSVFGSWKEGDNLTLSGDPNNADDAEFDDFIDLYVTDDEFYNMTDEELNNEYKEY